MKKLLQKKIEKKLQNYKVQLNQPDKTLATNLSTKKKVAVVGGGIAGISTASNLAERGFDVTLFEKDHFLGGKVGSWEFESNGQTLRTEHGFHAFFRQYYNLRDFLKKIDAYKNLIPIDDYIILLQEGDQMGFKDLDDTPGLNVVDMRKKGVMNWSTFINPKSLPFIQLLKYSEQKTFKKYDHLSFEQFAKKTRMPKKMRLVFNTFARAFFSEPDKMSMAELIKGFHFYFLSNNHGLLYDVLDEDFQFSFIVPCIKHMKKHGVQIKTSSPVDEIFKTNKGFIINQEEFDYCVLCTDVKHIRPLIKNSMGFENFNSFTNSIKNLQSSDRYAVLRIWTDKFEKQNWPFFIFTDRFDCLDSVTLYHKMEKSSAQWSKENKGGIFELHSYALPDTLKTEDEIKTALMNEFFHYFPELKELKIVHSYFQHRQDFPAFHVGQNKNRPKIKTEVPGLFLAGDWVKMNNPTMLMEAAYTSGSIAANYIMKEEKLQENELECVPAKGILA
jgi:isorenieratene synthase